MVPSFAQKLLKSKRPVVLFHTWTVTAELLAQAILEKRSMDLDVCVDDVGIPYLGHSKEYHEKTWSPFFNSMLLWEAVDAIANSTIPVIVDCKHFDAWPVVEKVVARIGPERCLVHSFVTELKFDSSRRQGEPDFLTEWSPLKTLQDLKTKFPSITTTASAKWLPTDVLLSDQYDSLLSRIRKLLRDHQVDTVGLNVPDETFSDESLRYFLEEGIIPHVGIDYVDSGKLSEIYVGETDRLEFSSKGDLF
ncbi:MAG: hypothetical protein ACLQDV_27770 [Candidatus Binataceae bacterium]